jgi:hypothetical protein
MSSQSPVVWWYREVNFEVVSTLRDSTGCYDNKSWTLNICSFVHQCNTFTFYFLLIVDMFRSHTAIFRCYSILSRSWCSVMRISAYVMLPAMCFSWWCAYCQCLSVNYIMLCFVMLIIYLIAIFICFYLWYLWLCTSTYLLEYLCCLCGRHVACLFLSLSVLNECNRMLKYNI